ncbi:N-acetyltransferase 10 [Thoreauomyces humboldtii]|nr:N-acetyltransferase 10 [Thoreauomyces humboldtii]
MVQTPQRKKLDSRIPTIIQNNVQQNKRTFFVLVGDRGRDQVVTLHFLLAKARVAARPNVLWCYKKELGFSSNRKKRMGQIKRQIARGIKDADEEDPFELFVSSTSIRYAYYKETEKILGNTYGMCILQDFEALTPNLLARTVETVEGGGIVVILLKTMKSLKQLYSMNMDVHTRYRTGSHQDTVARFNERFILSLGQCESCLVADDELNVLPISAGKNVKPLPRLEELAQTTAQKELVDLKESLKDTEPVGSLVECAKTVDQAKAILTFIEAIADKTLRATVALTAARGRGKSAALGIAMAAAVAYGYSNIFITSPSPENLKTLFEFIFKGFDALGYEEHLDYDIVQSTNPAFQKAVVRVNIFRDHRQTIQWIQPSDHHVLAQAELVVIDEAAAIPLPVVKKLLGPYLVFMASTINGYEGTGRSLSLKLLSQLREQSRGFSSSKSDSGAPGVIVGRDGQEKKSGNTAGPTPTPAVVGNRTLREIKLEEPIRYAANDHVESWLNRLLCLDCCTPDPKISRSISGCPHPSKCELYYVNRDTLFSFHPVSESFLQKMMALYVASHYKNTPNDLQLLSDAPAHHLFVLLPPVDEARATTLPEPLCVVQVCMEGSIAKGSALSSLAKGIRASGDLIPWVVTQQFQDDDFASLSGARVVRIATHPDYVGMGYGKRAVDLLEDYYSGQVASLSEDDDNVTPSVPDSVTRVGDEELNETSLMKDEIRVRDPATMPPLLLKLSERPVKEHLHWLGVSYGITAPLHKFWKRSGFVPVYLRQTANDLTGEHTCVMLKKLDRSATMPSSSSDVTVAHSAWLESFMLDFRRRFIELLSYQFKIFSPILVLSVFEAAGSIKDAPPPVESEAAKDATVAPLSIPGEISCLFTPYDLKRLESYTHNLLDYHVIMDLVPALARAYFLGRLHRPGQTNAFVKLSPVQAALLAGLGLQKKSVDDLAKELDVPGTQIMALFGKCVRKCHAFLSGVVEGGVREAVDAVSAPKPSSITEVKDEDSMDVDAQSEPSSSSHLPRDVMDDSAWDPTRQSLSNDLSESAESASLQALRAEQKKVLASLDLDRYAIPEEVDLELGAGAGASATVVNVPSSKKRKLVPEGGSAREIAAKHRGDETIVDPKGLMTKKKDKVKKALRKSRS